MTSNVADGSPLTTQQQELAMTCYPLAKFVANKFKERLGNAAVSIAMLSLCCAARDFRPEVGVRFSTFAFNYMQRSLVDAVRAAMAVSRQSPGHRVPIEGVEEFAKDWQSQSAGEIVAAREEMDLVMRAIAMLPPTEQDTLLSLTIGDETTRQIAERRGLASLGTIHKSYHKAVGRLRELLHVEACDNGKRKML